MKKMNVRRVFAILISSVFVSSVFLYAQDAKDTAGLSNEQGKQTSSQVAPETPSQSKQETSQGKPSASSVQNQAQKPDEQENQLEIIIPETQTQLVTEQKPDEQKSQYQILFERYISNDTEYQKAKFKFEQEKKTRLQTKLANGFQFNLSTGTVTTKITKNDTTVSIDPNVTFSIPELNNSSVKIDVPYTVSTITPQNSKINDASVLFSTDILSNSWKTRKVTLEKADRSLWEANRNLQNSIISLHIDFLTELRILYSYLEEIYTAEEEWYKKVKDLDSVKAKGYSYSSTTYKTAELEVESKARTVEQKKYNYNTALAVFASECLLTPEEIKMDFDFPDVVLLSIKDFDKEKYTEIEASRWNSYINTFERSIDKNKSLSAQAGYGLGMNSTVGTVGTTSSVSGTNVFDHTIKAGTTLKLDGFTFSANAAIPVTADSSTSVTLALGWNPTTTKINKLKRENDQISNQIDLLSIRDAEEKYRDIVVAMEKSKTTLEWQLSQYIEESKLYAQLLKETQILYDRGLINETEYRNAKMNAEQSKAKVAITKIERILYNDEIVLLFIPEDADKAKPKSDVKTDAKNEEKAAAKE